MLSLNFSPFPTLKTERILLREFDMNDAADVYAMRCDAEAMKYINKAKPQSIDEVIELISRIEAGINTNTAIGWAITLKNEPKVIGSIGYHRIDLSNHRAEIGYMLIPEFWRKGIMNEAIKLVVDYGFNTLNFHSIEANINPDNDGSRNILLKNGFIKEAYFKEDYFFDGTYFDTEIYSILNPNHI